LPYLDSLAYLTSHCFAIIDPPFTDYIPVSVVEARQAVPCKGPAWNYPPKAALRQPLRATGTFPHGASKHNIACI
jgi:hypothetical protein